MTEAAEKLKPILATLSAEDRAELLDYLESLEDGVEELTQEEWEEAWAEEANRRLEEMRSGKVEGIPAEQVMREMKEKYG